ncbi:olfactory receptor 5J3-like [Pleurodeles waltl]|uniref:olfactory receptor 5J3-like n=1 Tax=Pleurodeles waltl TaxID=8319 RepID=UPI0037099CE6
MVDHKHFQFTVLPFGLTSAPWVFTKVMVVVATHLRRLGVTVCPYLDNWLFKAPTTQVVVTHLQTMTNLLHSLGFTINMPKACLTLSQKLPFIWAVLDTVQFRAYPPEQPYSGFDTDVSANILDFSETDSEAVGPHGLLVKYAPMAYEGSAVGTEVPMGTASGESHRHSSDLGGNCKVSAERLTNCDWPNERTAKQTNRQDPGLSLSISNMERQENATVWINFILLGLTENENLQVYLFAVFLMVYTTTVLGNIGIMALARISPRLQTPMYFLLSNLSFADLCYSTVITPRMLGNFLVEWKVISYAGCVSQIFFFLIFASVEGLLLAVMAYDRYNAICSPLLYQVIMTKRLCNSLVLGTYTIGLCNSLLNTCCFLKLRFCGHHRISHFYCDIPPLLKVSCSDTSLNEALLMSFSTVIGVGSLSIIVVSYLYIISNILKIHSSQGKRRTFSTCASHFLCVNLFYVTGLFMYLRPNSSYSLSLDRVASVFYTVVIPMLNPLIYSLRNKEVKEALKIGTSRILNLLSTM